MNTATTNTAGAIINLSAQEATPSQLAAGVIDLDRYARRELEEKHRFTQTPTDPMDLVYRARYIAALLARFLGSYNQLPGQKVLIAGGPAMVAALHTELRKRGVTVLYSFEKVLEDGTLQHDGFIEVQ